MPLRLRYLAISGHKDLISNTRACLLFFQTRFQSRVSGWLGSCGACWVQEAQHNCSSGSRGGRGDGTGVVMMRPLKPCKPQGTPVTNPVERPRVREKGDKIVAVLNRPSCEAALEPVFTKAPSLCNYHLADPSLLRHPVLWEAQETHWYRPQGPTESCTIFPPGSARPFISQQCTSQCIHI